MTTEVKGKGQLKPQKHIMYLKRSPNGYLIRAGEDDIPAQNALNVWLESYIKLPRGKYWNRGAFKLPYAAFQPLLKKFRKDFHILPLEEHYGWAPE